MATCSDLCGEPNVIVDADVVVRGVVHLELQRRDWVRQAEIVGHIRKSVEMQWISRLTLGLHLQRDILFALGSRLSCS